MTRYVKRKLKYMPVLEWRYLEQVGPFARSNSRFDSKIIHFCILLYKLFPLRLGPGLDLARAM
jgi:hypothetical protein